MQISFTIHLKMCLFRVKKLDAFGLPRNFMWWTRKIDRLRLELSDGFQLIPNSCRMQYYEHVKLSTRDSEEYTGHEKL